LCDVSGLQFFSESKNQKNVPNSSECERILYVISFHILGKDLKYCGKKKILSKIPQDFLVKDCIEF
jgi:hypothetical protein